MRVPRGSARAAGGASTKKSVACCGGYHLSLFFFPRGPSFPDGTNELLRLRPLPQVLTWMPSASSARPNQGAKGQFWANLTRNPQGAAVSVWFPAGANISQKMEVPLEETKISVCLDLKVEV